MRLLVTGGAGQLGGELGRILASGAAEMGPVPACYAGAEADVVDRGEIDLTDAGAVRAWFASHAPYDVVVNCAAFTDVDGCETAYEAAYAVNAAAVANLAECAEAQGAKLVQVSTDYVFPGDDPVPRAEDDRTGPISAYGRTKLAGEEAALAHCSRAFVVRTAWLYGRMGKNFVKTMLRLGASHDAVMVVDDQLGNPTSANDLAYEILCIAETDGYGVYHCTNEGTCSWADFAEAIMRRAGLPCKVVRCTSEEYRAANPLSARRPAYSSLENRRLAQTIGNRMRPWEEALAQYLENLLGSEG